MAKTLTLTIAHLATFTAITAALFLVDHDEIGAPKSGHVANTKLGNPQPHAARVVISLVQPVAVALLAMVVWYGLVASQAVGRSDHARRPGRADQEKPGQTQTCQQTEVLAAA